MRFKNNYYEILQINHQANPKVIDAAYRILSKENHPDRNGDEEKMKLINEAHDVLSNPNSRKQYDHWLKEETRKSYSTSKQNDTVINRQKKNDDSTRTVKQERSSYETAIPVKNIYGKPVHKEVISIRESTRREPTWHDEYGRPRDFVNVTEFSLRFKDGDWYNSRIVNEITNIHRGDIFEVFYFNNICTRVMNLKTRRTYYNNPVINPEWTKYQEQLKEEERKNRNDRNKGKIGLLVILFHIFLVLSLYAGSGVPLIIMLVIFFAILC